MKQKLEKEVRGIKTILYKNIILVTQVIIYSFLPISWYDPYCFPR